MAYNVMEREHVNTPKCGIFALDIEDYVFR